MTDIRDIKTGQPIAPKPKRPKYGGRKAWEPSAKQRHFIAVCAAAGLNVTQIAGAIGVDRHLLARRCKAELEDGPATMNGRVAAKLYQKCMRGDTVALLFWTKTRMGWSEKQQVEHTGKDGGPIKHESVEAEAAAFTSRIAQMAERFAGDGTAAPPANEPGDEGELTQKSTEPPVVNQGA